jgi:glycosyltransferase involved in cell wall biosynthesis
VVDNATGLVVRRPGDVDEVTASLARLLDDEGLRRRLGRAARARAESDFDYETLAARLDVALGKLAE